MNKFLFFAIAAGASCTNTDATVETLEGAGYTHIETHGYAFNRCSNDDATCTAFTALGPTGLNVSGAVGCSRTGCGKGCTVRITHTSR